VDEQDIVAKNALERSKNREKGSAESRSHSRTSSYRNVTNFDMRRKTTAALMTTPGKTLRFDV
jgi:hypothetical protein